jgi:hypothetical protein
MRTDNGKPLHRIEAFLIVAGLGPVHHPGFIGEVRKRIITP